MRRQRRRGGEKNLQKLKLRSTEGSAVGKDELENPKTRKGLIINPL